MSYLPEKSFDNMLSPGIRCDVYLGASLLSGSATATK